MSEINDPHKNLPPAEPSFGPQGPAIVRTSWGAERRGWLRRNGPDWLLALPASVDRKDAKIYMSRLLVPIVGGLLHLMLVAVYLIVDVPWLAALNLASVAIFAVATLTVRSGRHYLGAAIAVVEVWIHIPAATLLIGLKGGYLMFNFIVAMAAALVYSERERRERYAVIIYSFTSSAACLYFMHFREPLLTLAPEKLETIFYLISAGTFIALMSFAHHFVRLAALAERRVQWELERSDALLLNILPAPIAARLKASPTTIADSFPSVSVLFADIVGFTNLASVASGEQVVTMLNDIFSTFDRIAERYGLEKIKTIGDAYMAVGGIPVPMDDHAAKVTAMALDMLEAIRSCAAQEFTDVQLRIGIHSGPVVAGVIGQKKFTYDLWGDTVNTASRMESHGAAGRVQVSAATRALLGDLFEFEDRGEIEIKGKGKLTTHYVLSRRRTGQQVA